MHAGRPAVDVKLSAVNVARDLVGFVGGKKGAPGLIVLQASARAAQQHAQRAAFMCTRAHTLPIQPLPACARVRVLMAAPRRE